MFVCGTWKKVQLGLLDFIVALATWFAHQIKFWHQIVEIFNTGWARCWNKDINAEGFGKYAELIVCNATEYPLVNTKYSSLTDKSHDRDGKRAPN